MGRGLPTGPSEDGVYHVWSLCYARSLDRRTRENFLHPGDIHDGPMPVDFNVWLLVNAHRTILVDTGFNAKVASARRRALDFDPVEGIARLGLAPEAIEDVIVTHLHFDHAGNLDRVARARFHIQDAEMAFATGRCMCEPHIRRPFEVEDVVTLVQAVFAERVCFHDGDAAPFPGVTLHALPGHSKGVQAVRVNTPRGPIVLASDVSHYYANVLRRAPFALTIELRDTLASYQKLRTLAGSVDRIIPGHDPKVRKLYPAHRYDGVDLTALHEQPLPHDAQSLSRVDDF